MNIVLINQFFPPAQAPTGRLLADLAAELARRGHAATVLASAAGYGAEAAPAAAPPTGVRVVRVGRGAVHRHGAVAKLRDYAAFYRGAWRELSRMPWLDAVVCLTTPPFIGLLGRAGDATPRREKGGHRPAQFGLAARFGVGDLARADVTPRALQHARPRRPREGVEVGHARREG